MHLLLIAEIPGPQGVQCAGRTWHHPQRYTYHSRGHKSHRGHLYKLKKNRIGLKTLPCGIPLVTLCQPE